MKVTRCRFRGDSADDCCSKPRDILPCSKLLDVATKGDQDPGECGLRLMENVYVQIGPTAKGGSNVSLVDPVDTPDGISFEDRLKTHFYTSIPDGARFKVLKKVFRRPIC